MVGARLGPPGLLATAALLLIPAGRAAAAVLDVGARAAGPDPAKINISLQEYETTITTFLETRRKRASIYENIPELVTFDVDKQTWHPPSGDATRLRYNVLLSDDYLEVESSTLHLLLPPQPPYHPTVVRARVSEVLGARRLRFLDEKTVYLSTNATKWVDFDVSAAVQGWISGEPNLGFELLCLDCASDLRPVTSGVTSLITGKSRAKRQADEERLTDCDKSSGKKRKCCRHEMKVNFKKLPFAEMRYIVEPKTYEAGYCHGLCPPDYHLASNHSRIQSLVRQQMNRSGGKKKIPKACCTPSKLGSLDILMINEKNPSKLTVHTWDNMRVIECACS